MTANAMSFTDLVEDFGDRWNRFWFTPADPLPCCVLRICVGLLAAAHFLDLSAGLPLWSADNGVLPPATVQRLLELTSPTGANYHYSYLGRFPSGIELTILHGLAIGVSLAFAVGLFPRVTGALSLVAVLAYVHRAPQVAGHVEPVLSFLLAYLLIAPAGARLSINRWLFKPRSDAPIIEADSIAQSSVAANISLRLIQVHVAMFYAMMGLTKLYGDAWWDGSAVWILLAQTESRPLDLSGLRRWGALGQYLLNFWTHAVVYFELAFPVLIWSRTFRPLLLAASFLVWLSLIIATGHVVFGLTMLAANIAFLSVNPRTTAASPLGLARN